MFTAFGAAHAADQTATTTPASDSFVGKRFKNPYPELEKNFKMGLGISFGEFGKQIMALDVTGKTGRRVLVFKELGTDEWITTGDFLVSVPAKATLVGTATTDEESGEDPPHTCFIDGKVVNGFGYLKVSKGKFSQPAGALAWTVDENGVATATAKLSCKF